MNTWRHYVAWLPVVVMLILGVTLALLGAASTGCANFLKTACQFLTDWADRKPRPPLNP